MSAGERRTRRGRAASGLRTVRARFRALDRRDRLSLLVWVLVTALLAPFVIGAPGRMHASEVVVPGTESAKAQALGDRAFGRDYVHLVLLQGPPQTLDEQGPAIAHSIAQIPEHRVLDPWSHGARRLHPRRSRRLSRRRCRRAARRREGSTPRECAKIQPLRPRPDKAIVLVGIQKSFDAAGPDAERLRERLRREVKAPLTVHLTGFADLNRSIKDQTVKAMELCEVLAAPLLVLVLILILGSPIAAAMPLMLGGCVAVMQVAIVDLINRYVTHLEVTAVAVGMAMSLALGVDYALLLVARFRRELGAGADVREASQVAAAVAGRTVKLAAVVLAAAMTAATLATPASVLKSATVGVLTAVTLSVLGATFALPPLLRWAGRDINRYQIVSPGAESGRWSGVALAVLRRPAIAAVVVLAVMLGLAAPALNLQTGPPDARILPKDDSARADFDVIEREIGASQSMPFVVTVVAKHGLLTDARLATLAQFQSELARVPGTAAVLGPATVASQTAAGGTTSQDPSGRATIAAIAAAPPAQRDAAAWTINWDRGGNAVQYLVAQQASYKDGASLKDLPSRAGDPYRARLERSVDELAKRVGATAGVGGNQATIADFDQAAKDSLARLVIVLVLVTYIALVGVLRSVILPLIAVALNVLTLLAAFGVMALAFGPDPLLGGPGFVDDIMVMVVYTVTFALSIDYAVFLLDRMREGWVRTRSVEEAITYGIEGTAGVITGAAVIVAAVFFGFLLSPIVSLRQLGLALSVAVILDATLIRLVLLPAALRLVGERAWRTPRWLDRLARRSRARKKDPSGAHGVTPRSLR